MKPAEQYNARYVWMLATVAALGGLLFGYDWVVIGGAKPFYEAFFQLHSERLIGWANSCALLGCLLGSLFAGAAATASAARSCSSPRQFSSRFPPCLPDGPLRSRRSSSGGLRAESPSESPPMYRRSTSPRSAPRHGVDGWCP